MDLVLGIKGQLVGEAVVDVDVGEDPLLAVLDDPLLLDLVGQGVVVESVGDDRLAVGDIAR